jgi:hypothetical protein
MEFGHRGTLVFMGPVGDRTSLDNHKGARLARSPHQAI